MHRRRFLGSVPILSGLWLPALANAATRQPSRVSGMLMGSLIGDALGGPLEFLPRERTRGVLPNARLWDASRVLDDRTLRELRESLTMHSYESLRPDTAPYGPWSTNAKKGTVTDDSRHKIVVMRALAEMVTQRRTRIDERDLARHFVKFQPHPTRTPTKELTALVEEGLREYRFASRWLLGQREDAYPPERLWAGVNNCSGQMALLPLAGLFAGQPEQAYLETYGLDFIDAPIARDICAALVAGLAAALDPSLDSSSETRRRTAFFRGLRTDPYHYRDVPFAGRQLDRWLDLSDSIVRRAAGRPAEIYRLLEEEGKPVYYWDAHFTLLVPLTMLKACRFEPLAAMHLTLDFGHDSDSYAQVLGAIVGALHGVALFPTSMVTAVANRLNADFDESVEQWERTLSEARDRWNGDPDR